MNESLFKVTAILGSINMPLKEVIGLEKGSIIDLGISCGNHSKVFYKDKYLFSGTILVFEKNLGIKIMGNSYSYNERKELLLAKKTISKKNNIDNSKEKITFDNLNKLEDKDIYFILQHEHPQTIALICLYLKDLKVLDFFSEEFKIDVLIRLSRIEDIDINILISIQNIINKTIENSFNILTRISGLNKALEVLKSEDNSALILSKISEKDEYLSEYLTSKLKNLG